MTKDREQQMLKASQLYPKHQQKVFVDGVLWGDAHPSLYSVTRTREAVEREREYMIRKACEWLAKNMEDYTIFYENYAEHFAVTSEHDYKIDFIDAFRKAMEEQQ